MLKKIKELYMYRQFLKTSVKKEFRGKYKKSVLGILWSFINPLLQLLVYALVFPFILRVQVEIYIMFIFTALIPWNFFSTTLSQSTSVIISNGGIIKKVYFPREILPISIVLSGAINFLISCIIILVALLISGIGISPYILFLPLILFVQCLVTLAICFVLSAFPVYIRDLEYFINVLLQLWMYITPVVYPLSQAGIGKLRYILLINPVTTPIELFRCGILGKGEVEITYLIWSWIFTIIVAVAGIMIFNKVERTFMDTV